jgi:aspartate racemase
MRIAGIVGGIGPESTIEYYRFIIAKYRALRPGGGYPRLVINSIDLDEMIELFTAGRLDEVTIKLAAEVRRLAAAGVDFGLFASNTPHAVFEALRRDAPIPLVSIVEVTCAAAQRLGLKRPGLIGTRFTMQGRFYPEVFQRAGLPVVVPVPAEQEYIHGIYMNELLNNVFRDETRQRLLAIVGRLRTEEGIDGLILGGTELPLILRDAGDKTIPFLDTTQLHCDEVVARLLS